VNNSVLFSAIYVSKIYLCCGIFKYFLFNDTEKAKMFKGTVTSVFSHSVLGPVT